MIASAVQQAFGTWSGTAVDGSGREHVLNGLVGWRNRQRTAGKHAVSLTNRRALPSTAHRLAASWNAHRRRSRLSPPLSLRSHFTTGASADTAPTPDPATPTCATTIPGIGPNHLGACSCDDDSNHRRGFNEARHRREHVFALGEVSGLLDSIEFVVVAQRVQRLE